MRRFLYSGMVLVVIILFVGRVEAVQIFPTYCSVWDNPRTSNHEPFYAIDGDTNTYTWSTESDNRNPNYIGLDFGLLTDVNRIRLWKDNLSGVPGWEREAKDLTILYTVDSADINLGDRSFMNVSGLVNGYNGTELMDEATVNSDGTVYHDYHDLNDGWASLTFNNVLATGVAIYFTNNTPNAYHHYKVHEFEAHSEASAAIPEPTTMLLLGTGLIGLAGVRRKVRN